MKLFITDYGDHSVGLWGGTYEVDVPFEERDKDDLDYFRKAISDVYAEFADGGLVCMYDFEIEEREKMYNQSIEEGEIKL